MSPVKNVTRAVGDDADPELLSPSRKISILDEKENTKAGNATPKKNALSKLGTPGKVTAVTSAKKAAKASLKTPVKVEVPDQTEKTPGNLGDPSPLQTRSARKKKAAITQGNSTPKPAEAVTPVRSATSEKKKVGMRKPTPGKLLIKAESVSEEDSDNDDDELDSDDLDSDDAQDSDEELAQPLKPSKEKKGKGVPQAVPIQEKSLIKTPAKGNKKVDAALAKAAQTPLPMSPEVVKTPVSMSKKNPTKVMVVNPFQAVALVKTETELAAAVGPSMETVEAKTPSKKAKGQNKTPAKATPAPIEAISSPTSKNIPTEPFVEPVKTPAKKVKGQKKTPVKAEELDTTVEAPTASNEPGTPKTTKGAKTATVKAIDGKVPASPKVVLAETSDAPAVSPNKRSKSPKEQGSPSKKAKLADAEEGGKDEATAATSGDVSAVVDKKKLKRAKRKETLKARMAAKLADLENGGATAPSSVAKPLKPRGPCSEEELAKLRKEMEDKGMDAEAVEEATEKLRRMMVKRSFKLRCKNCFQRGHVKLSCPQPPRAFKCYKCGSAEHQSMQCSIKERVYTFAECPICSNSGHLPKKCPNKPGRPAKPENSEPKEKIKGPRCYKCGEQDHIVTNCSIKEDVFPFAKCRICRVVGHMHIQCPKLLERKRNQKAGPVAEGTISSITESSSTPTDAKPILSKKAKKRAANAQGGDAAPATDQIPAKKAKAAIEKAPQEGEGNTEKAVESKDVSQSGKKKRKNKKKAAEKTEDASSAPLPAAPVKKEPKEQLEVESVDSAAISKKMKKKKKNSQETETVSS